MTVTKEQALRGMARDWIAIVEALQSSSPLFKSESLTRELLAAFLLLRWADLQDATGILQDGGYQTVLPDLLQWRHWSKIDDPNRLTERLRELSRHVASLPHNPSHPLDYLRALADPLERAAMFNSVHLVDLVRWVKGWPFETPSELRWLLMEYEAVLADTGYAEEAEFSSSVNLATLVTALANPQPGETAYDPCFGTGNLLSAVWQQANVTSIASGNFDPQFSVSGIEINASAFLLGFVRMILAGVGSPRLQLGNSLQGEPLRGTNGQGFDLVVANFPVGETTRLFVQHALSQIKPHGRAVIAVPQSFLFRGGQDRTLRAYMLEHGMVEAVIGIPAEIFAPHTGIKGCLLVLNKQGGITQVRMADATAFFDSSSLKISHSMANHLATMLRSPELPAPRQFASGFLPSDPGAGRLTRSVWEVSVDDLKRADWDLSPRRREEGGLDEMLRNLKGAFGDQGSIAPLSSVSEIFSGRGVKSSDLVNEAPSSNATGYVRIRDLKLGKVGRLSSWLKPELTSGEERGALLAGDVVISKSGTIGKAALVREDAAGSIAANGLYVLRIDQKQLDADFLLAYLASPACQNWLKARSRGAVIQHLHRAALDELPVPVPPIALQARAVAEFLVSGTDVLTFLSQALGNRASNRLTTWLAELDAKVPQVGGSLAELPPLTHFEPILALVGAARSWLELEQVGQQTNRWLGPLTRTLSPLEGVAYIPVGPGLLGVLQEAERGMTAVLGQTFGYLTTETQARAICERLRDWVRASISSLLDDVGLQVNRSPSQLVAGDFAEFSLELENVGALPLRNLRVKTLPDWGITEVPYVPERATFAVNLRGNVPKQIDVLALSLQYQARELSGKEIEGQIEIAIRVAESPQEAKILVAELGGSPYVTGSALEPQHGHSVFYGREALISRISREIASSGNVVLLEGNRRTGKTSILKHLEGRTAVPGWLAVYASLQGAEGDSRAVGVPTVEVFREVARNIAMTVAKLGVEVPLPNGKSIPAGQAMLGIARACREGIKADSPFTDFREYLSLVLAVLEPLGLGLLLMLDEFDKLQEGIDNGVTSPQVPENIRFLIQTYPKFSAILTGSRRLKRLREEYWSALYGLGTSIQVTALDEESARKVVVEPVQDQLTFSQEAVDRITEITARHPYLMQCLCNRIFEYAVQSGNRSITKSVVSDVALSLVRDNEHFASLWDYAGLGPEAGRRRRQLILVLCARSFKQGTHIHFGTLQELLAQTGVDIGDESLDADLTFLRELELLDFLGEIGNAEYRLAIPLMAEWIQQQQDVDVVASRARTEAEEENA